MGTRSSHVKSIESHVSCLGTPRKSVKILQTLHVIFIIKVMMFCEAFVKIQFKLIFTYQVVKSFLYQSIIFYIQAEQYALSDIRKHKLCL